MVNRKLKLKHGKHTMRFTHRIVKILQESGPLPAAAIKDRLKTQLSSSGRPYRTHPTSNQIGNILGYNLAFVMVDEVKMRSFIYSGYAMVWSLDHEYMASIEVTDST